VFEGEGDEKRPLDNCDTLTVLGIFLDAGGQSDESYEPNPFLESVFEAFDLAYTRSSTNLEPA